MSSEKDIKIKFHTFTKVYVRVCKKYPADYELGNKSIEEIFKDGEYIYSRASSEFYGGKAWKIEMLKEEPPLWCSNPPDEIEGYEIMEEDELFQ
jgi:hypothetical protein